MKTILSVWTFFLFIAVQLHAQIPPNSAFSSEASPDFENGTMPYRMYKPTTYSDTGTQTYPLMIWLHGLGERGTNNTSQLSNGVQNLVSAANQTYDPAFLIVPQIDGNTGGWAGETDTAMVKAENRLLMAIDDLKARFRINPDRIYLMGLSNGAGGTWNLGTHHPGLFAALSPMSEGGNGGTVQLGLLAHMPVWCFDGSSDSHAGSTLSTINALRSAGGRVTRTLFNGTGHGIDTWGAASSNPDFYKWWMAQTRLQNATANPQIRLTSPSSTRGFSTAGNTIALGGTSALSTATLNPITSIVWNKNGGGDTAATGTTSWSGGTVTLSAGANFLQALATAPNNSSAATAGTCTFNDSLVVNDGTAPSLTLQYPTAGPTYTSPTSSLTLRGIASDNVNVCKISWSNDRGGSGVAGAEFEDNVYAPRIAGQLNWFISKIPLQTGHNIITLTAQDLAGNGASQTLDVYRAPGRGGDFFRQDFNSSNTIGSYFSSLYSPPANDLLNDISAATNGGTWSINGGALQISRTSGVAASASFLRRFTTNAPAQGVAAISFDFAIPGGSPGVFTNLGTFTMGFLLNYSDGNSGLSYSDINTELNVKGAGSNKFTFNVNSVTSSTSFNSDGTNQHVTWFVNSSGAASSYLGPDNATYSIPNATSDVWVGTTRIITAAAKNSGYKSRNLGSFRFNLSSADLLTMRFDNLAVSDFSVAVAGNQPPVVNAGSNQTIVSPASATLSGSVTDDGVSPGNPSPTATWSKFSGPGTVTFGNANAASTTASFSTTGTYVLRLLGSDGVLSATDDVTITVNAAPTNQPPTVNAGNDQTVTLPSSASLSGSVIDDGLAPGNPTPTATWSKFSGPGTVTFGNANTAVTTASFSVAGTYVLRLTGYDGVSTATDDVTILVNEASAGLHLLFDFGEGLTVTTATGWNNLTGIGTGTSLANCIDAGGATTTVGLAVTQGFNGTNNAGLTTAGLYPITAKQDTFWVQNATVGQIRLSGLNPASAYNLTFFASRSTGGTNRVTKYAVGAVTTTLDATDNVSTTATLNAVIPNASGQIDISISNNINSGYGYIGVLDLQEVPPLSALQTWKNTQFGANASIPAIAGDTADPDADGIVNLMEYALGGLPNTASTVILPVLSAPTDRLQITFTRLAPTDVTYLVQSSTDLIAWTTIATFSANGATWTGAATVNETGSGATRNVIVPDTTVLNAGSKRFLRLKITTP